MEAEFRNEALLGLCRAIGPGALPPDGRLEFNQYDSSKAFDAARNGADDVFFLSASEIIDENFAGKIVPGPTVFYRSLSAMAPESSKPQHLADLAGEPVCSILRGNGDNNLEGFADAVLAAPGTMLTSSSLTHDFER